MFGRPRNPARFTRHIAQLASIAALFFATPASAQWLSADTLTLPPAGYGRLSQEDLSLDVRTDNLLIRVQPIHPVTLRVMPRDAHDRMTALLRANETAIEDGVRRSGFSDAGIALITIYGTGDRTGFSPAEIVFTGPRGILRAAQIIPLTPDWESHFVETRRTERAFFVLDAPLNILETFTATYRATSTAEWGSRRLRLLEDELLRAKGRAAADGH
jgi:hypothetical protein